jgi:creatinine amidohydrolase
LTDLTWPEVEATHPVLVVPVGSCEQHGPHLPLGTDTLIAETLAARLVAARDDTVVAPSLAITASGEHAGFPGTLSIGTAATQQLVIELVRSADWASGIVLVNGHGGNRAAIDHAVAVLHAEGRDVLAWWPTLPDADAHAGDTETSLVLAVRPELVRRDRAVAGPTAPLSTLIEQLRAGGVATVSRSGVLGDPSHASATRGETLLTALRADLLASFDAWRATR